MSLPVHRFAIAALLFAGIPLHATAGTDPSGQWQPDTKQNARLFKEAEKKFEQAAKQMRPPRGKPEGGRGGPPPGGGGGMGPPPGGGGGMGGPPGGGRGGPPPGDRPGRPSLSGLLPAELAFAAPAENGLILQRMRDAVAFGRDETDAVVIIPFAGKTDLGNGVQATMRDEGGSLVLQAETLGGLRVQYRYRNPPDSPGALQVDIDISGERLPGGGFELQRIYRRVQVEVAEPEKAEP